MGTPSPTPHPPQTHHIVSTAPPPPPPHSHPPITPSNILPLAADLDSDFFTESSRSALRAAFASWPLEQVHAW